MLLFVSGISVEICVGRGVWRLVFFALGVEGFIWGSNISNYKHCFFGFLL